MSDWMKGYLCGVFVMCVLQALLFYFTKDQAKDNTPKEQIKPVECLTYYQWTYWSTKRDRVLNKRKRTHTDSLELRNADRILGLDETLNNPPR